MPPVVNPWLALPTGRPGPEHVRRLRAAHERLVTGVDVADDAVRSVVRESWRRSLGCGVDPDGGSPPVELLDDDLLAYREAHPLATVMPVIRRLLVEDAEDDKMIVAVTDAGGRMLWVEGDFRLRSQAAGMHSSRGPAGPRTSSAPTPPAPRSPSTTPSRSTAASTSAVPSSRGAVRPLRCTTR